MTNFKYSKAHLQLTKETIENILVMIPKFVAPDYARSAGDYHHGFNVWDWLIIDSILRSNSRKSDNNNNASIVLAMLIVLPAMIVLLPPVVLLAAAITIATIGAACLPVVFALDCGSMLVDSLYGMFKKPKQKNTDTDNAPKFSADGTHEKDMPPPVATPIATVVNSQEIDRVSSGFLPAYQRITEVVVTAEAVIPSQPTIDYASVDENLNCDSPVQMKITR